MTFGQETGRALSDGRIVGRAEPFAKVFPSSREVKRAVGLVAWAILEDIALDARLDDAGRLVSTTNVRRIATNLGINKDTAAKHLARLRDFGFVLQEEGRQAPTGRWEACQYVLDPSACLERFTHTPPPTRRRNTTARPVVGNVRAVPCPTPSDAAADPVGSRSSGPVSDKAGRGATGRGEVGHNREEVAVRDQQQRQVVSDDVVGQLAGLGIAADRATLLVDDHGQDRIRAVVAAAIGRGVRNPSGWVIRALVDGWDLGSAEPGDQEGVRRRAARRIAETQRHLLEACDGAQAQGHAIGWAAVLDDALDDGLLLAAIDAVAERLPAAVQRSVPVVRAHLLALAAEAQRAYPQEQTQVALRRHLRDPGVAVGAANSHGLLTSPPPGQPRGDPARLASRIAAAIRHETSMPLPPRQAPTAPRRTQR